LRNRADAGWRRRTRNRNRRSDHVKSFGCRLASESPRGTNPRAGYGALWVFEDLAGCSARIFGAAMSFGLT
jgi:hypothetical protein